MAKSTGIGVSKMTCTHTKTVIVKSSKIYHIDNIYLYYILLFINLKR